MSTRNDITGDLIATKASSDAYREGYERIFAPKIKLMKIQEPDASAENIECKQCANCTDYKSSLQD